MEFLPEKIETEEQLEDCLSQPGLEVINVLKEIPGDIMILGVAGKIGPSLARLLVRSCQAAGIRKRIIGVARFTAKNIRDFLEQSGVETISCDLLKEKQVLTLPQVENLFFLAGMKFGSTGNEPLTWAINTYVPALVASHFRQSRIVALSTGNVYPFVPVTSGGCRETDPVGPVGEYAQSCLGRERIFQYFSQLQGTPVCLIRLNYAVELRYGVLLDIALKVKRKEPVSLATGFVNVIWQGEANRIAVQCLKLCQSPARIINLTGPEIISVRQLALRFGEIFQVHPVFQDTESPTALLSNPAQACQLFGPPRVTWQQMVRWVASWISQGGKILGKQTHFETRDGRF
ncbi:MAG: NAD-dependent epimerase/dehydratase family protein [Candidatus Omnitrophica bacterium]|nr:NAD-dependent epimerase/dehydratase family protein [Candidatus Omnitrophota bacterium]